jgi:hypothetical protein
VATVNPIFTWVRLAQRIPVRIHIDEVPPGVVLSAGMTATVEIDGPTVTSLSVLTLACVEADRDPTRRPSSETGRVRFASDCVVGLGGLEPHIAQPVVGQFEVAC